MPAAAWLMNLNFAGGTGTVTGVVSERYTIHGASDESFVLDGISDENFIAHRASDESFSIDGP